MFIYTFVISFIISWDKTGILLDARIVSAFQHIVFQLSVSSYRAWSILLLLLWPIFSFSLLVLWSVGSERCWKDDDLQNVDWRHRCQLRRGYGGWLQVQHRTEKYCCILIPRPFITTFCAVLDSFFSLDLFYLSCDSTVWNVLNSHVWVGFSWHQVLQVSQKKCSERGLDWYGLLKAETDFLFWSCWRSVFCADI